MMSGPTGSRMAARLRVRLEIRGGFRSGEATAVMSDPFGCMPDLDDGGELVPGAGERSPDSCPGDEHRGRVSCPGSGPGHRPVSRVRPDGHTEGMTQVRLG